MLSYGCLPLRALAGGVLANRYDLASPWIVGGVLNLAATAVTVAPADPLLEALTGRIHSRHRCKRHANYSDPIGSDTDVPSRRCGNRTRC
jgi:hypothetical protein